jgi:NADH:ubiquinone oxidoreductase subunit 3 (subunit A)
MGESNIYYVLIICACIVVAVVGNGLVVASILSRKKTREKKNSK